MKIAIASKNPIKINAALAAFSSVFKEQKVESVSYDAESGVPDQPMSYEQTREGAYNRVQNLLAHIESSVAQDLQNENESEGEPAVDYVIAYEGGVDVFEDGPKTFAIICISNGQETVYGQTATLPLPMHVYQNLLNGMELGDAMDSLFNTHNIKQKGGAIGQLTSGLQTRLSIYESATVLALSYFALPDVFAQ
jgi:inosine/xanthosine triphosphatase